MTDLASAEAELSNYIGALDYYKKALSIDPHHIGAMVGVGLISKKLD
ncbi:MAG: tetratricopeptide repeat protein [Candidatus Nitrosopolaris sp.]